MSIELKNIFPEPDTICKQTNQEIRQLITDQIKNNGKIQFYDMLKFFNKAIDDHNFKKASISAYYCTNALLSNQNMTGDDKAEVILSLRSRIEIMQGRDPTDVIISGG